MARGRHMTRRSPEPERTRARAVAAPRTTRYEAYFGPAQEPIASLARRYGKPGEQKIHFSQDSMCAAWLDRSDQRPTIFLPVGRRRTM
ncbi:MAG TPA: hypothetical protein VMY34_01630 [Acidimicrobiales bacterium]|nr:hypothetical protein [Acidimicrobiales bacterium]